jgi:hypothetical protein
MKITCYKSTITEDNFINGQLIKVEGKGTKNEKKDLIKAWLRDHPNVYVVYTSNSKGDWNPVFSNQCKPTDKIRQQLYKKNHESRCVKLSIDFLSLIL